MESLMIQCPIPVKAIMTEELREELMAVEQAASAEMERQLATLQTFAITQDDVFERQRRLLAQHAEIETRLARLSTAPLGEEFLLRVVQASVEIRVGDNFLTRMGTEILLENGVVRSISAPVYDEFEDELDVEVEVEPELEPVS